MGYKYYDPDGQLRDHADQYGNPRTKYVLVQTVYGSAVAMPESEARRRGYLR